MDVPKNSKRLIIWNGWSIRLHREGSFTFLHYPYMEWHGYLTDSEKKLPYATRVIVDMRRLPRGHPLWPWDKQDETGRERYSLLKLILGDNIIYLRRQHNLFSEWPPALCQIWVPSMRTIFDLVLRMSYQLSITTNMTFSRSLLINNYMS